jgi:hypothetical protein
MLRWCSWKGLFQRSGNEETDPTIVPSQFPKSSLTARRQSGHDGVGDLPLSPAFRRQALRRGRGEANQIKSRGDYPLCFNKIPYLNRLALSIIENPKNQMAK